MTIPQEIQGYAGELTAIRRDLHAHPELGFQEVRTSGIVAQKLASWGIEVHRGLGGTGVVGVLEGRGGSGRRIGLRADMDALPIEETTNLPYRSTQPGTMHACGHDGHTTILLGAARYLADTRNFDGTAVFIFQPAEEGLGGARAMLKDGLFERFPCDEIYGLHNAPDGPFGYVGIREGAAMAAADFFDIRIVGKGTHAARPDKGNDPIVVAFALGQAMQTIVSRNVDPIKTAVVSITRVHAGAAYNVIPGEVHMAGTMRTFDPAIRQLTQARLRTLATGIAAAYDVEITMAIDDVFSVLVNVPEQTAAAIAVARELFGTDKVDTAAGPFTGSEDFADMLHAVPGCYVWLCSNPRAPLHNAAYDFDDAIIPLGAALFARLVETRSAAGSSPLQP